MHILCISAYALICRMFCDIIFYQGLQISSYVKYNIIEDEEMLARGGKDGKSLIINFALR